MRILQSNCVLKKYIAKLSAGIIVLSLSSCGTPLRDDTGVSQAVKPDESTQTAPVAEDVAPNRPHLASSPPVPAQPLKPLTVQEGADTSPQPEYKAIAPAPKTNQPLQPFISPPRVPAQAQTPNTVTVTIYKPDSECKNLLPEKVAVPATEALEATVGKVLKQRNTVDFNLAGYRVSVQRDKGVAIVDLRVSPGSVRQFVSLSSCEQFALFGTVRQTLTSNSLWQIDTVVFTDRGEEIEL